MVPGDGVGPELMTAVKELFKVKLKVSLSFGLYVVDDVGHSFIDVIQKCIHIFLIINKNTLRKS